MLLTVGNAPTLATEYTHPALHLSVSIVRRLACLQLALHSCTGPAISGVRGASGAVRSALRKVVHGSMASSGRRQHAAGRRMLSCAGGGAVLVSDNLSKQRPLVRHHLGRWTCNSKQCMSRQRMAVMCS